MILALRYGDLSSTISETNRLANELGQYCDDLSKKVQQKMYSVEGGMSSALNSADYYVKAKINQLRARENNARTLSSKNQILLDTARRVDTDVERMIEANQKSFFKKNPELKAPWYKQAFTSFMCDLKNISVISWLIKGREQVISAIDTLLKDIRYWYNCGGGKELVGIVLSVVAAVLAVVILVCAVAFTGGTILAVLAGIAGVIAAIIGLVNAVTNIVTSLQAYNAAIGGHPGRAKIYADQDKLSDVLRQANFHNREWNRGSNAWATGLDITESVCAIITLVSGAVKTAKAFRKINISKTFQAICQPRNELGQFVQGKPTLWNGIKSIALKFNVKDFVLGDLNVKNLSRLSKLPTTDAMKAIGDLAKAIKGVVDGLDKVNEGEQSLSQFFAKRAVTGLETTFLKEQKLTTKIEDGVKVRKYGDTNITTIIKAIRLPIDGVGLSKLLTDAVGGSSLSDTLNIKGGLIKNVTDIIKSSGIWNAPQVIFDSEGIVTGVENWDSASGYFSGLDLPSFSVPQASIPNIDTTCDITAPTFAMPTLDFNFNFACKTPYFNVTAA